MKNERLFYNQYDLIHNMLNSELKYKFSSFLYCIALEIDTSIKTMEKNKLIND